MLNLKKIKFFPINLPVFVRQDIGFHMVFDLFRYIMVYFLEVDHLLIVNFCEVVVFLELVTRMREVDELLKEEAILMVDELIVKETIVVAEKAVLLEPLDNMKLLLGNNIVV